MTGSAGTCEGPRPSQRKSARLTLPADRPPSFPPIPPPRRSTGRPANERDRSRGRIIGGRHAAGRDKTAGIVGAAFRRRHRDLAIRLAVLPALSVSVADRCVLALS